MSDKFKDVSPVNVTFSAGEQPSASKLTSWATQIDTAFKEIEKALGDLKSDSHPLFISGNTPVGGWAYDQDGNNIGNEQRHLQIMNISRLIGPSSVLNPRVLTGNTVTITESIPGNQNQFKTKYSPISSASVTDGGSSILVTSVGSADLVYELGSYHIDTATGVITYISDSSVSPGTITYDVVISTANASDTYEGATFNVIPDPNQDTVKCTVSGPSAGQYTITLPVVTQQQSGWYDLAADLDIDEDPNYNQQLTLPTYWSTEFVNGDVIPEGLIQIWDKEASSFLEGQTFYYVNQTSVKVDDTLTLVTGSDRYSLVTIGTDITRTLDNLRTRFHKHSHTGEDGSRPILHKDLSGKARGAITLEEIPGGSDTPITIGWTPDNDDIKGNDHPQYLHRYGMDNSTLKNALFGDLLFAPTEWDGTNIFHSTEPVSPLDFTYSNRIRFLRSGDNTPQVYATSNSGFGKRLVLFSPDRVYANADIVQLDADSSVDIGAQDFNVDVTNDISMNADDEIVMTANTLLRLISNSGNIQLDTTASTGTGKVRILTGGTSGELEITLGTSGDKIFNLEAGNTNITNFPGTQTTFNRVVQADAGFVGPAGVSAGSSGIATWDEASSLTFTSQLASITQPAQITSYVVYGYELLIKFSTSWIPAGRSPISGFFEDKYYQSRFIPGSNEIQIEAGPDWVDGSYDYRIVWFYKP